MQLQLRLTVTLRGVKSLIEGADGVPIGGAEFAVHDAGRQFMRLTLSGMEVALSKSVQPGRFVLQCPRILRELPSCIRSHVVTSVEIDHIIDRSRGVSPTVYGEHRLGEAWGFVTRYNDERPEEAPSAKLLGAMGAHDQIDVRAPTLSAALTLYDKLCELVQGRE